MFDHSELRDQVSFVIKLSQEVKLAIYKVVYLLLKQDEQSFYISLFCALVQLFQLLHLSFGNKIAYVWNNTEICQGLNDFLKYFSISINLEGQGIIIYLSVFYIFFCLVIICYMLFIIFAFSNKIAAMPLMILRILIKLFLTVGFAPIMLLFFGLSSCEVDDNGVDKWIYNTEYVCWGSEIYVHSVLSIVAIILFQVMVSICSLIYFESKEVYHNSNAQRSGRPYSYYHINIFVIVMTYQLLDIPRFSALFLFIFAFSSFLFFFYVHKGKPFYNNIVQKCWSIVSALYLWTALMQIFAYWLEGEYFTKVLFGWMGGIPLLILIIIKESIFEVDLLSANINKSVSGQQIIFLCEYLLNLLDLNDQHAYLMLEGFIEIHKQTCVRTDCVLKTKRQHNDKKKNKLFQENDRQSLIIDVINQIYYDSIKSYPQDVYLRLNYSYFLMDRLKLKQQALTELQQAELSGPSFDHEFIIYRYKKIMEDELQEQQQIDTINQADLVTEMAFQTQSKQLISQIERTSLIYIDFWTQLQEEVPDLGKLCDIGFKIIDSVKYVDDQWFRLKRLNQKAIKLNILMGKFYQKILNDEESGQKLISTGLQMQNEKLKILDIQEIQNQSLSVISILTDNEKLGTINNVNKAACSLLGFTKADLINRKLNAIQPDITARYHDHFLENFLGKNQDNFLGITTNDKLIYAKNKQGYILPCALTIKMLQSMNSGMFMCGILKQEVTHKPQSIIICSPNGIIENINSITIKLLNIDLKSITLKSINIMEIFPDIFERKENFLTKNGAIIHYQQGTRSSKNNFSQKDLDINNSDITEHELQSSQISFQCIIQEIRFTCLDDPRILNNTIGYIIKLEKVKPQNNNKSLLENKKNYKSCLQFRFNLNLTRYVLDLYPDQSSNDITIRVDQSVQWEDQTKISQQLLPLENSQIDINKQQNYGEGIKILRLIDDKIIEVEEVNSEELDEELGDSQLQQSQQNQINEDNVRDTINLYKSKRDLENVLKYSKIPRTAHNFQLFINLITFFITTLGFIEFFIDKYYVDELNNSLPLIAYHNLRGEFCLGIQSQIQDLKFINLNYLPYLKDSQEGYTQLEEIYRDLLNYWITQLINYQKTLTLASAIVHSDYQKYENYFFSQNTMMTSYNGATQNYTYSDAIQSIIAKSIIINGTSLAQFTNQNEDYYYLEYNLFHQIIFDIFDIQEYYKGNIMARIDNFNSSISIILIIACVIIFVQILFVFFFFIKLQVVNIQVLQLFLDLDEKTIKQIYNKCENFITNLQKGDEDDEFLSDNEDYVEVQKDKEESESLLDGRKKRKKFKNSNQAYKKQLIVFFGIQIISISYFIYLYVYSYNLTSFSNSMIELLNITSYSQIYYRYADNAFRKLLEDENYLFIDNTTSTYFLQYLITDIQNLDAKMHQIASNIQNELDEEFQNVFNQIFILNPCEYVIDINQYVTLSECNQFSDEILQQGLSIGMSKFFETFKSLANSFNSYSPNQNYSETYQISDNNRLNYMFNLINGNLPNDMRLMQKVYIEDSYQYLGNQLLQMIDNTFQDFFTLRVSLFISFIVFLFVAFFIGWVPLVYKSLNDMLKIRMMLGIIPLSTIYRIASIRKFIRKVVLP